MDKFSIDEKGYVAMPNRLGPRGVDSYLDLDLPEPVTGYRYIKCVCCLTTAGTEIIRNSF